MKIERASILQEHSAASATSRWISPALNTVCQWSSAGTNRRQVHRVGGNSAVALRRDRPAMFLSISGTRKRKATRGRRRIRQWTAAMALFPKAAEMADTLLVDENDNPIASDALRPASFKGSTQVDSALSSASIICDSARVTRKSPPARRPGTSSVRSGSSGLSCLDRILKRLEEAKGELFAVRVAEKPVINTV